MNKPDLPPGHPLKANKVWQAMQEIQECARSQPDTAVLAHLDAMVSTTNPKPQERADKIQALLDAPRPQPKRISLPFALLRWLLILPAALGAYMAVQVLLSFAPVPQFVVDLIGSFSSPLPAVLIGTAVAPGRKAEVGTVLAILLAVAVIYLLHFSYLHHSQARFWWLCANAVVSLVVSALICVSIFKSSKCS